jgi:hypothetical protein
MTDADDPFGDLDDSLGEEPGADASEAEEDSEPPADTQTTMETEQHHSSHNDKKDRPAFPFDQTKQSAIYARNDAWQAFEDALDFDAKRELRDRGHENIEGRELHEATLLVAAENPELIADKVEELRNDIA